MIETRVVSRELAERLKQNGFPQETVFCWRFEPLGQRWFVTNDPDNLQCHVEFGPSAPLLSEVLEQLPREPKQNWAGGDPQAHITYYKRLQRLIGSDNILEDSADLWLWWKEQE